MMYRTELVEAAFTRAYRKTREPRLDILVVLILLSMCSSWSATDNIKNLPILFTSFLLSI